MAAADSSSRPVLRRTQPKVLPKTPPAAPKPLKSAPSIAKKPSPPPVPAAEKISTPKLRSVQIPVPGPAVLKPVAADLSPASVLHDQPSIVDEEDDSSSIASSSCHSSPCFRKDPSSSLLKGGKSVAKKAPPRKIPEAPSTPAIVKRTTTTMFPSPQEVLAQRKLKISHYGRKQGSLKAVKVVLPEESLNSPATQKRCAWISPQCDPAYIAYHDEEWGVPVHDDNLLFELLVLAGAQSEMGWSLILSKRDCYRRAFQGFDPAAVAAFDKKKVAALKSEVDIYQQEGKLQAVIENAGRVLQIVQECGSLSNYLWGFLNHKPVTPNFRMPAQVPIKTSKSEFISRDLVRRGFSCVGPTTVYSLMQAAGMTNDHTTQCFRHKECAAAAEATTIKTGAPSPSFAIASADNRDNLTSSRNSSVFVH
ncbi:uncharacterized protein LOC9651633 [Selaginella moellendorffii]|uniref:uncharacterized protein LOC9651633 n=1 Tax=Selaginella moellendorffii TaxID=88036 RepID=UPI000D1C4220|nr:uncharacterized protein LOC9651633 [Selaginella moellendorffii]|eukprot:XP_002968680.2 uncharacterized protein LOC9651633 [Selaginella moellendorffii]